MTYLDQFLNLKCASGVINTVAPINSFNKEITESMAVIKQLRSILLKDPEEEYELYDLCAGNALTSVTAAHLFKNLTRVTAIDKLPRKRAWEETSNFRYLIEDIYHIGDLRRELIFDTNQNIIDMGAQIIISVHSCGQLAKQIIKIFQDSIHAKHLILMPCCIGQVEGDIPGPIRDRLGKYLTWCWELNQLAGGQLYIDSKIQSPANGIIVASK